MLNYLVRYERERDFTKSKYFKILGPFEKPMAWRELQTYFDPGFHHNNLEFFPIGEKLELKEKTSFQDFFTFAII